MPSQDRNQNYDIKIYKLNKKMGSRCCAPQLDDYQIKLDKVEQQQTDRQQRKGLPSEKIAIKVSDLNAKYKSQSAELQKINKMIFTVAEYERKFKNPFRVNKEIMQNNRIPEAYYIPSLKMFYVGEWVFNEDFNENVPGGVGRLYEQGTISEGIFKTFLLDAQEVEHMLEQERNENQSYQSIYYKLNEDEKEMSMTENRNRVYKRPEESKIQRILKADRQKMVNDFNFVVKLNGTGRISSIEQNGKDEILMEGQFTQGLLNGKGTLKMIKSDQQGEFDDFNKKKNRSKRKKTSKASSSSSKMRMDGTKVSRQQMQQFSQREQEVKKIQRKTDYFYSGYWKLGIKHGKGIQKVQYIYKEKGNQYEIEDKDNLKTDRKTISTQSFRYEGNFFQNSKHGKGNLTFIGLAKNEHLVQKDIQRLENQMINQGDNIKAEITKNIYVKQYEQQVIQKKLDELGPEKLKAHNIKFKKQRSLLFDVNFNIQRTYRTIFSESYNGDFKEGNMEGQGTYVWSNGKTYRGQWTKNKLSGYGEFYWPDGTYYQGTYQDDQRYGQGTMIWNSSKRYRGKWAFGMRHGYGQSIEINQSTFQMIIKGSIWDRDKVKAKLFEYTVEVPELAIKTTIAENKIGEQTQDASTKKKKKKDETNLKSIVEQNMSVLSNSLSRLKQEP